MDWHYDAEIRIKKLETAPWGTNCYIVACPTTGEGIIIDTPSEDTRILEAAEGVKIRYIVITHTHPDHLGAFRNVMNSLAVPVAVHPSEAEQLPSTPDLLLNDGDTLEFGNIAMTVIHTPGHTPGGLCLLYGKHLFSGDTLFPGGPGKTMSPADFEQIVESITGKLFVLADDTAVYPGHGSDTTIGREKEEYAVFASRPRKAGLCGDVVWASS